MHDTYSRPPQALSSLSALLLAGSLALSACSSDETESASAPQASAAAVIEVPELKVLGDSPEALAGAAGTIDSAEEGRQLLTEVNESFVTNPELRANFAELVRLVAETDGPVVIHCTAGKDRTGWAAALLLSIAGVDRATVVEDYEITNVESAENTEKNVAALTEARGAEAGEGIREALEADPAYLEAAFKAIERDFGDFDTFASEGLGLSDETVAAVRATLLG